MSLVIRLARAGTKKRPVYHIVIADSRSPRDGRFLEVLGHYSPLTEPPTVGTPKEFPYPPIPATTPPTR